jgi:ribonuclease HI
VPEAAALAPSTRGSVAVAASDTRPDVATRNVEPLWAEASDLLDGLDAPVAEPIQVQVSLSGEEHARLRDRADAQGVSLEEALRRLI